MNNKEKLNNVIDFRQVKTKKKYFLMVSDSECVLECWANSYIDLAGVVTIYDDEEKPHKVNMIVDVLDKHIYEMRRDEE